LSLVLFSQEWRGHTQNGVHGSLAIFCYWDKLYLDYWAVTGDPQYMTYKTPTVAPKPFIKWVARAGHMI
jgi:hypothetical protein